MTAFGTVRRSRPGTPDVEDPVPSRLTLRALRTFTAELESSHGFEHPREEAATGTPCRSLEKNEVTSNVLHRSEARPRGMAHMRICRQGTRIRPAPARFGSRADGEAFRIASWACHRPGPPSPEHPGHDVETIAAGLAQLVEQLPCKHQVASSSLAAGTSTPTLPVHPPRGAFSGSYREGFPVRAALVGHGAFSRSRRRASSSAARASAARRAAVSFRRPAASSSRARSASS